MRQTDKPHQIIFFNGPRRSGKDTLGNYIFSQFPGCRLMKFASPLKQIAKIMSSINEKQFQEFEKPNSLEKLAPNPQLFDRSWVELLITISEQCLKPVFGKSIFGDIAARQLVGYTTSAHFTVFTDSGFVEEAIPIVDIFGKQNCHLVHIVRPDHTFDGDSRSYWELDTINHHTIQNLYDLELFKQQGVRLINKIMEYRDV